jgi:hypothetical protein
MKDKFDTVQLLQEMIRELLILGMKQQMNKNTVAKTVIKHGAFPSQFHSLSVSKI